MPQVKKRGIKKNRSAAVSNVFDSELVFGNRIISDYKKLKKAVEHCKGLGLGIVLTSGTWDLVHIGHARYFQEAKRHGDLLVVGVDSDEKVRNRKGPDRPIVPEDERMEMVTHLRYVDLVFLKQAHDPKWHLIKLIRPDVLILTDETYNKKTQKELKKYCGEIVVLKPQATTSTSAKIRRLQISTAKKLQDKLTPRLMQTIEDVLSEIKEEKLKK